MRRARRRQLRLGETDIANLDFDLACRDDIPKLLMGLQYIYTTPELREAVFEVLFLMIRPEVDCHNGRPGMDLWNIFVLGTLRLNLNCDYDRLHDLANNHKAIRHMLGHGLWDDDFSYRLQTLKDNVSLFTPEILDKINQIVVSAGHQLLGGNVDLRGKCDSFVVETDVHYPTDINLLFDAIRKAITEIADLCSKYGYTEWRKSQYNIQKSEEALPQSPKAQTIDQSKPGQESPKRTSDYRRASSLFGSGFLVSRPDAG